MTRSRLAHAYDAVEVALCEQTHGAQALRHGEVGFGRIAELVEVSYRVVGTLVGERFARPLEHGLAKFHRGLVGDLEHPLAARHPPDLRRAVVLAEIPEIIGRDILLPRFGGVETQLPQRGILVLIGEGAGHGFVESGVGSVELVEFGIGNAERGVALRVVVHRTGGAEIAYRLFVLALLQSGVSELEIVLAVEFELNAFGHYFFFFFFLGF